MEKRDSLVLPDENLRKNQFLIEVIIPNLSEEIIINSLNIAFENLEKNSVQPIHQADPNQDQGEPNIIEGEPTYQAEPNEDQADPNQIEGEPTDAVIITEMPSDENKNPKKTTKTHEEIMKIMNKKTNEELDSKSQDEPEERTEPPNAGLKSVLIGDLIKLIGEIDQRLEWYNDIDFNRGKGINERKEQRSRIVKFEKQTIDSFAKKLNQIFILLEYRKTHSKELLSSAENRDYSIIYNEFEKSTRIENKIILLDELKMIPSAWLPSATSYNRRKNVAPVISSKVNASADKGE